MSGLTASGSRAIADGFAAIGVRTPARVRAAVMSSPARELIAEQILRGMTRELDAERAASLEAVIRWELGAGSGKRTRSWTTTITGGRCRLSSGPLTGDPDVTLRFDYPELLELALGTARGPELFMTGRIKVEGNLMLAQRLTTLFRIPVAAARD